MSQTAGNLVSSLTNRPTTVIRVARVPRRVARVVEVNIVKAGARVVTRAKRVKAAARVVRARSVRARARVKEGAGVVRAGVRARARGNSDSKS